MPIKLDCVDFCKALADPTRQKILEMLLEKEKTVSEVVDSFKLTQPTVSHHLEILSRNGLLTSRREGKQVYYRTNQNNVVSCCGKLMSKFDLE
jgi:ArsR family transcriptional regulator, arsenate/arsenite/antimonite-responsive transcriptional repressor